MLNSTHHSAIISLTSSSYTQLFVCVEVRGTHTRICIITLGHITKSSTPYKTKTSLLFSRHTPEYNDIIFMVISFNSLFLLLSTNESICIFNQLQKCALRGSCNVQVILYPLSTLHSSDDLRSIRIYKSYIEYCTLAHTDTAGRYVDEV